MFMDQQADILTQIYLVMTANPEILTDQFIEQLLTQVLPLAESDADNDTVEKAINALYKKFTDDREKIKASFRKSLDGAKAQKTPDYSTVTNNDDTRDKLKRLEASLAKRLANQK